MQTWAQGTALVFRRTRRRTHPPNRIGGPCPLRPSKASLRLKLSVLVVAGCRAGIGLMAWLRSSEHGIRQRQVAKRLFGAFVAHTTRNMAVQPGEPKKVNGQSKQRQLAAARRQALPDASQCRRRTKYGSGDRLGGRPEGASLDRIRLR